MLLSRSFAADAARSLEVNNPASSSSSSSSSSSKRRNTRVVPIPLAQTGEGIKECELVAWRVSKGDAVDEFGPLCEVQSDKAAVEITARHAGVVERLCFAEGDMVEVGATLCELRVEDEDDEEVGGDEEGGGNTDSGGSGAGLGSSSSLSSSSISSPSPLLESPSISLASPAVRRIARELGLLDLSLVEGTGPGGRVLKGDVERHVAAAAAGGRGGGGVSSSSIAPPSSAPAPSTAPSTPQPSATHLPLLSDKDVVVPLRGYRRAMVSAMESSLRVPHFHFMDEYDVGSLLEARRALAATDKRLLESGTKLTLLPFVIKAISLALSMPASNSSSQSSSSPGNSSSNNKDQPLPKQHALVNASLSASGDAVVAHADHNVGVAIDTPRGLVVPVVRRVQDLSVAEVAEELSRLQRGLLGGSGSGGGGSNSNDGGMPPLLLPESDLRGATITVSNIGSLGGAWATPLVHPPQAAIVALGRVRPRLVLVDGKEAGRGGAGAAAGEKEKRASGNSDNNNNKNGSKKNNNASSSSNSSSSPHPTLSAVPSLPMSWGADHRIVDGAGLARFAADVGAFLSEPARMLLHSR